MQTPSDVPIHRPSVGAMSVAQGSQTTEIFRPYTYRGLGFDLFEPLPEEHRPRSWPELDKPARKSRRRPPQRAKVRLDIQNTDTWGHWPRRPTPQEVKVTSWAARRKEERRLAEQADRARVPHPQPASGWKPMTGADIETLLQGLE